MAESECLFVVLVMGLFFWFRANYVSSGTLSAISSKLHVQEVYNYGL